MKGIAVQLYSLRDRCKQDFVAVLKDVASFGYQGVETAGLHGKSPAELRKILDDLGMKVCSQHIGLPTKDNAAQIIDEAKALGCQRVISGFGPDDFKTLDAVKAGAQKFQAAAELLAPAGIKMGYHNHWWEFELLQGRYGFNWFFEQCPAVFSELDLYWACHFNSVDVSDFIAGHKAIIPLFHVKDGPLVKDQPHTAVGQGKMNIPACIKAADPRVLEWLIVELDECATDMTKAVKESYTYLHGLTAAKA